MELDHVTYRGPNFEDDHRLAARLPDNLRGLLKQINGFIQYVGGLHLRGLCAEPAWHGLDLVWTGPLALHENYAEVRPDDVPFAQDCMADQFLLRGKDVLKLYAETGELEDLSLDLRGFLEEANRDPVEFLGMHPLLQAVQDGHEPKPGQVLHAYPPFCMKAEGHEVSLRPVPIEEALAYLAHLSKEIRDLPEGAEIELKITD